MGCTVDRALHPKRFRRGWYAYHMWGGETGLYVKCVRCQKTRQEVQFIEAGKKKRECPACGRPLGHDEE